DRPGSRRCRDAAAARSARSGEDRRRPPLGQTPEAGLPASGALSGSTLLYALQVISLVSPLPRPPPRPPRPPRRRWLPLLRPPLLAGGSSPGGGGQRPVELRSSPESDPDPPRDPPPRSPLPPLRWPFRERTKCSVPSIEDWPVSLPSKRWLPP